MYRLYFWSEFEVPAPPEGCSLTILGEHPYKGEDSMFASSTVYHIRLDGPAALVESYAESIDAVLDA